MRIAPLLLAAVAITACEDTTAPLPVFGDVAVQAVVWDAAAVQCTVALNVTAVGGDATVEVISWYGAAAGSATLPVEVAARLGTDHIPNGQTRTALFEFPGVVGDVTFAVRAGGHRPVYAFATCR